MTKLKYQRTTLKVIIQVIALCRPPIYQIKNHSAYKDLHYFRQDNSLTLYSPMSLKYDQEFLEIETKILSLPDSILEIIFFQSNIAIIWDEMQGSDELLKIKTAILNI